MHSKKFQKAFEFILKNEGGYVNDPRDPGGETKYGISKRSYPKLDIKNLTLNEAKKIYYRDYWLKSRCDKIDSDDIAIKVFDLCVNTGVRTGVTLLQRALRSVGYRVLEDGILGEQTAKAVNNCNRIDVASELLAALKSEAAGYYRGVVTSNVKQKIFLSNWLNRAYKDVCEKRTV